MASRVDLVHRRWGEVEFRSSVQEIGETTTWSLRPDRPTLKILREGEIRNYVGGVEDGPNGACEMHPGSISLVPAGRAYRSAGRGTRIAYSVVSFPDLGDVTPLLNHRDEFVYQTVARIDEALAGGEERLGEALGHALLLHLKGRYAVSPTAEEGLELAHRRRLDAYLEANLGARPTVADLARELGMSRTRFTLAFRRAYGTTPARYVLDLRLAKARRRLEVGPCDLTELALELGFASHAHLTTAFKNLYGRPPRDFRAAGRLSA